MEKKILYIDMDGVIADFNAGVQLMEPFVNTHDYNGSKDKVDAICEANPTIFHHLPVIKDAVESVKILFEHYEVYFLSTPMWNVPLSFTGKRIWIDKHFGVEAEKRLILTFRKDLAMGDFLVDDKLWNGVDKFKGKHLHFGCGEFPDWNKTLEYLIINK